jgi:glycosyltransferase involved in cell wall biosynthesis
MPAYNEEALIEGVVRNWLVELSRLGIDYEMRVYDDGSRDRTGEILDRLAAAEARLLVIRQTNCGHGATILRGYNDAASEWIFQVDGDGEIPPAGFEPLWRNREGHDFLVGFRQGRQDVVDRRLVTRVSRLSVRLLYGPGIVDVNSPCRLMRRTAVAPLLPFVAGTFAPNVILSGLAVRAKLRIYQAPVQFTPRTAGTVSIAGRKLWRVAARSFRETVAVSFKHLDGPRP